LGPQAIKTKRGVKMKKLAVPIMLALLVSLALGYLRTPAAEFEFYPWGSTSRPTARHLDTAYAAIYDSAVMVSFVMSSSYETPRIVSYLNYVYLEILHPGDSSRRTPWSDFNGNIPVSPFDRSTGESELMDSLLAAIGRDTSPFEIVFDHATEDTIYINVNTDLSSVGPGPFRLFVFVLENYIRFYGGPSDGYKWIAREIFPTAFGTTFTPTSATTNFAIPYYRSTAWNPRNLELAIFIDDSATHEILQAAHAPLPVPDYYYAMISPISTSMLLNPGDTAKFMFRFSNLGANPDTISIRLSTDAPPTWTVQFCIGDSCFGDSGWIFVDTFATETVTVVIVTDTVDLDISRINVVSISRANGRMYTAHLMAGTGGELLLVNDGRINFAYYYEDVLNELGVQYLRHDRSIKFVTPEQLQRFSQVIWYTSDYSSRTLLESDKYAIKHYLNSGGKLFITGAEIGWDLILDGRYTDTTFFERYLHASADSTELFDAPPSFDIDGVPGNLLGWGLHFSIRGGDGANNGRYSDVLTPVYGALPILRYRGDSIHCAGLCFDGAYRVVYLGFPFEAIDNHDARLSLMRRILNFLESGIDEEKTVMPKSVSITATPNPFNPICLIKYSLVGVGELSIYDLSGKKVFNREVGGSGQVKWNAADLPSGIYLIKLTSRNDEVTRRITLLK